MFTHALWWSAAPPSAPQIADALVLGYILVIPTQRRTTKNPLTELNRLCQQALPVHRCSKTGLPCPNLSPTPYGGQPVHSAHETAHAHAIFGAFSKELLEHIRACSRTLIERKTITPPRAGTGDYPCYTSKFTHRPMHACHTHHWIALGRLSLPITAPL